MAATRVGIIYSIAQRRRRVVVVPDDDSQLNSLVVRPGERLITQTRLAYRTVGPDAAVRNDSGGLPRSDRCAVIHGDLLRVWRHIHADDSIDSLNGFILVNSSISQVGDTWRPLLRRFLRRYVSIDRTTRLITSITTADPENPPTSDASSILLESDDLIVGDIVPAVVATGAP